VRRPAPASSPSSPAKRPASAPARRPPAGTDRRPTHRKGLPPRVLWAGAAVLLFVVCAVLALNHLLNPGVVRRVTIEAGTPVPAVERFVSNARFTARFASDVSALDTSVPGTYDLKIAIDDKEYDVTLAVADTTPPAGDPVDGRTWKDEPVDPSTLVADLRDATAVTVAFKSQPDYATGGDQTVVLVLTDASGNQAEVKAKLTVLLDTEKPSISGVVDVSTFVGDPVAYRTGVTVTDNRDADVLLEIDNAGVDLTKAGTYPVVYSATDKAGNRAEVTANVVVTVKPAGYVSLADLNARIDEIFAQILKPGMSDLEKMSEIFYYIADHIAYTGTSDKDDWIKGAYLGITRGSGDCFNYFALAKGMLERAGYETIRVERVPAKTRHYWNLVKYEGQWYHFDPLPNLKYYHYVCLLRTDAEVAAFSKSKDTEGLFYVFDHTGIPATATVPLDIERKVIYG